MKFSLSSSLLAICCVFPSVSAWAVEMTFGLNVHHFDYKEELDAPLKSTEKANVYAPFVQAKIPAKTLAGNSFVKLEGEISGTTKSDYDGSTQTGDPVTDTNSQSFVRAEGDLYLEIVHNFYLYAGLGLRYWNRYLNGGSGYREIYSWYYSPLGIYFEAPLASNVTLGLDASYRTMFGGQIKVIFSETVVNGDDTDLTLGNRPGYKLQVPLKIAWSNTQAISLAPWYEYSEIGSSDFKYNATMKGYIQEPSSRTIQYGLAAGLMLTF